MTPCRSPMRTAVLLCIVVAVACLPVVVSAKRVRAGRGAGASQKRELNSLPIAGNLFEHRSIDEAFQPLKEEDSQQVASNTSWKRMGSKKGKGPKTGATDEADETVWRWKSKGKKCKSSSSKSSSGKGSSKSTKTSTVCNDEDNETPAPTVPVGPDITTPSPVEPGDEQPTTPTASPVTAAGDTIDTCAVIDKQEQPEGLENDQLISFDGVLSITYDTEKLDSSDKVVDILGFLQKPVALWCAGCEEKARTYLNNRRRSLLQRILEDGVVDYAELSDFSADGACSGTTPASPKTCNEFTTELKVWSEVDADELKERAEAAFALFAPKLVEDNDGIDGAGFVVTPSGSGNINNVVRDSNTVDDEGLNAGGAVAIAAGCLALLLLLLLLVRRRRDSDEVSHLKLEDEGEATFIHELDSQPSNEYSSPRKTHVVGEEDSIFSGWTGYPKDGDFNDDDSEGVEGILGKRHGDVHACASATCEVCEQKRRQGLQFIPTGSPPRPVGLPSDAARDYIADDTVEL